MFTNFINDLLSNVFSVFIKFTLNWLVKPIFSLTLELVKATLAYYFYQIGVLLLSILDFIADLFRMVAGLEEGLFFDGMTNAFTNVTYDHNHGVMPDSSDLLFQLVTSKEVLSAFIGIVALGVFLLIVFTLYMVVKQELNLQKSNNKVEVAKIFTKGLIYMLMVPVICIFGVYMSNSILKLVDAATGGKQTEVSGIVFAAAAYGSFYEGHEMYMSMIDPYTSAFTGVINAIINTLSGDEEDAGKFDFGGTGGAVSEGGKNIIAPNAEIDGVNTRKLVLNAYRGQPRASMGPDDDPHKGAILYGVDDSYTYRSFYNAFQVSRDFNGAKINYLVWYFFAYMLLKTYLQAIFGLVQRLYKAVMLFLVMPGPIGMMPMDEGSAFSSWRKQFTSEVLGAYGIVIAMNLFMTLSTVASTLEIEYNTTNIATAVEELNGADAVKVLQLRYILIDKNLTFNIIAHSDQACMIMQTIFIMVGALMINKLASTISSILGGADILSGGASAMSEFSKTAGGGAKVGAAVVMGGITMSSVLTKKGMSFAKRVSEGTKSKVAAYKADRSSFMEGLGDVSDEDKKKQWGQKVRKDTRASIGSGLKSGAKGVGKSFAKGGRAVVRGGKVGLTALGAGAIMSPTSVRRLYKAQAEADAAKYDRDHAKSDISEKDRADLESAYSQKQGILEGTKAAVKGTGTFNVRASLKMAENDILSALPGMNALNGMKKNFKTAKDEVSKQNSIDGDLRARLDKATQDSKNKKDEKKHEKILDALAGAELLASLRAAEENLREYNRIQEEDAKKFTKRYEEAKKLLDEANKNPLKPEDLAAAKERMQFVLRNAKASGLDVSMVSKDEVKIEPNIRTDQLKELSNIMSKSKSGAEIKKNVESFLKRLSTDMQHNNTQFVQEIRKNLEQILAQTGKK